MSKYLFIVESPAKAKTIKKILGQNFTVKASVGHIKDLPKSKLGVDIENNFQPEFNIIDGKEKIIEEIVKAAKQAEKVYLAPDPDREGEAIAWHIAEEIQQQKGCKTKPMYRVQCNEITKPAIEKAVEEAAGLSDHRYKAQLARRILDRLVGYQLSPLLWEKVRRGLSAGRVQSVAVRIVCDREREIRAFKIEEYWTITARLIGEVPPFFEAKLTHLAPRKKAEISDETAALKIVEALKQLSFVVDKVHRKERKRQPPPPFITSTLQQEASRKLKFNVKHTMRLAQQLYEGTELGDAGAVGLITYMRTDSTRIADEAIQAVRAFISETYGLDLLPQKPNRYRVKQRTQDAHEAIRPTYFDRPPESVKKYLEPELFALYELIWNRFVACQMEPAIYDATTIDIKAGTYTLRATGSVLRSPGFLRLYSEGMEAEEEEEPEKFLPNLSEGSTVNALEIKPAQHFTQPPPKFSEAALVKELEEKGIGRPSTYATILSTIREKEYVKKANGKFVPSELGFLVTDLLVENFPSIMDVKFTAEMENTLDQIETGSAKWIETLQAFYGPFSELMELARKNMRNVKTEEIPTEIVCERCGKMMVIRWGRNGNFLACSAYPECKNTSDFEMDDEGKIRVVEVKPSDILCEKCGRPMVEKSGRYGRFYACSGYPDCKHTRPLSDERAPNFTQIEETDELCDKCGGKMLVRRARTGSRFVSCSNYPNCKNIRSFKVGVKCLKEGCNGDIVERSSKRGRIFYGCSRYPSCDFVMWDKPVNRTCPKCSTPVLAEKKPRDGNILVRCTNRACDFSEIRPQTPEEKVDVALVDEEATENFDENQEEAPL